MPLTRRSLLRCGFAASVWAFAPLARAESSTTLKVEALKLKLNGAAETAVLGFNGASPGPLIRLKRAQPWKLALENSLENSTLFAVPGMRSASGPLQRAVAPGARLEVALAPNDAGLYLYGAFAGVDPFSQQARGLYGALVVEEDAPLAVDVEALALIADWRLDAAGAIADLGDASFGRKGGRQGGLITVNGAPAPARLKAPPGGRVRLRLANAATARAFALGFSGARPLVIAVDGQPSEPFEPRHNQLPVAPGARFEMLIDLPEGTGGARLKLIADDGGESDFLVIEAAGAAVAKRPPFAGLAPNPALPGAIALERSKRVALTISGGGDAPLKLAGVATPGPGFTVERGSPVTLALKNDTAFQQTLRLGGHFARLLHELDDGWEPYWRDLLVIPAGKSVHAAFVADGPGVWALESVSPECRAAGLATTFKVG